MVMTTAPPCEIKDVLQCAREEATMLGHSYIGTKHILLGALRGGKAAEILEKQGVELEKVRDVVRDKPPTHSFDAYRNQLPVTTRARNIIKAADEEAALMHSEGGADSSHLLLALLRDPRSASCQVLRAMNVTYDSVLNDFC